MKLPSRVDDPSLREHEPLRSHITMYESCESRRHSKAIISGFVREVQENSHATAAIKKWAYLLFKDLLSSEHSLEVTGGGEELYRAFFEYQIRLSKGNPDNYQSYQVQIYKRGTDALNLKNLQAGERVTQGRSNQRSRHHRRHKVSKNNRRQAETAVKPPDVAKPPRPDTASIGHGAAAVHSSLGQSTKGSAPRAQEGPVIVKSSERFVSDKKKKKKRKARSQNPPATTTPDASEDDKEIPLLAAVHSVSHRSKRVASNPCLPHHNTLGVYKVYKTNSTQGPQRHLDTVTHQCQSLLVGLAPEGINPPLVTTQGRRGSTYPLNGRKRDLERISNATRRTKSSSKLRKGQGLVGRDLAPRAHKRQRRASMSIPHNGPGEVFVSPHGSRAQPLQEPIRTIPEPFIIGPPSIQENPRVVSKTQRKRTRIELESGYVASDRKASPEFRELLGPDNRLLRPLPKKICDKRSTPIVGDDASVSGVPCGTPSLEDVDQFLRDAAGSALAILEGVGSDLPDWTEDKEYAEYDGLGGDDADEVNDDQVAAASTASSVVVPKPPLPTLPRIWAQSRQEVCESFEYFRSYHSGVYSKDDIVKGYLLGAYAASRDIFHHGGRLIISHGGGKSESILDTRGRPRRYQQDMDQESSDKSVRALLKTWKTQLPIVLLADDRYAHFPYDLASAKCAYVVLGLYWISHAWAECQFARDDTDGSRRIVRWKFAFQWCEGQGDPWWISRSETTNMPSNMSSPISNSRICPTENLSRPTKSTENTYIRCGDCQEQSPNVYKQGWMCLNPRCNVFWNIDGGEPKQLDYREEFLRLLPRTFIRLPNIVPTRILETASGVTTTVAFTKGFHCTKCGRLSCRFKWEHWECSNCQFKHVVNGRLRSPKEFWGQHPAGSRGFTHGQIAKNSGIKLDFPNHISLGTHYGSTMCLTYILPGSIGKIYLILGTPRANEDADNIFELYQRQASTGELKLRRYPLQNHKARGLLLTNYFSQNSGEPYQYVGGTGNTVPFDEAPECVQRALALIKERSSLALRTDIPFNEILSAAYMERQKMSFHSDSEKGLGPVVASLSLGSAALMHFRPNASIQAPSSKYGNNYALTLVLRHGDVLIMEGEGVQKCYEHTVVPLNFRIAATARCIGST